ncbi:MAG: tyrosine-type recombinase/integrase [Lachnospiraceae bacterium]|nr:tyrosine-type recombinase/integrase [Lachnospiraceae bacterium]
MNQIIVNEICRTMKPHLSDSQLDILQETLKHAFSHIRADGLDLQNEDCNKGTNNFHILNLFLSAKHVEGCSDKTLRYYSNTLSNLFHSVEKPVEEITTDDLRLYLTTYQNLHHSSKVTIDNVRRIFSSFFVWLEDEDYIIKSPVRRIKKVRTSKLVKETLSDENLEMLRDHCKNTRDLALIDLLSSTGIRVGELVRLNRYDINFHERECIVLGKGDKERTVYFDARAKIHLRFYLESRTDDNPALFVSLQKPHNRLSISGVEYILKRLGNEAQIAKVHPHKFRRTMATMAIDKGMPIEQVQTLLGHVSIDTTLHYAAVNQNNVKISHKKYLG